jgi:hypothetical protein
MHPALKLLTGLAATVVVARGAALHRGQSVQGEMARLAATVMLAHGVQDGSVRFRADNGIVGRVAHLSGSADPATRRAIVAEVAQRPEFAGAMWVAR